DPPAPAARTPLTTSSRGESFGPWLPASLEVGSRNPEIRSRADLPLPFGPHDSLRRPDTEVENERSGLTGGRHSEAMQLALQQGACRLPTPSMPLPSKTAIEPVAGPAEQRQPFLEVVAEQRH